MTPKNEKTTILIADDHPVVRQGLADVIHKEKHYQIVAECGDGPETLQAILDLKPNVALMDISMPGLNGLQIVGQIRNKNIPMEFIILTMYSDPEYFDQAIDLGVKGYLIKDNALQEIISCLEAVASGRPYFCPSLSQSLLLHNYKREEFLQQNKALEQLTATERQVLHYIAQGKTSRQIAGELFVSVRTVQNHRHHICQKLKIEGYNKLLQFAMQHKDLL